MRLHSNKICQLEYLKGKKGTYFTQAQIKLNKFTFCETKFFNHCQAAVHDDYKDHSQSQNLCTYQESNPTLSVVKPVS